MAPALNQVGFTDFVGQLLSEVFDSVISAEIGQEQSRAELVATAALDLATAAPQLATDAEVDTLLAQLFPTSSPGQTSAVFVGALYQPPPPTGTAGAEAPAFAALLGVTLVSGQDFHPGTGAGQGLTAAGVQKIRDAARAQLAAPRLDALRRIAERGVPRVVVDAGQVSATFTFQLESTAPPPAATPITLFTTARLAAPAAADLRLDAPASSTLASLAAAPATPFRFTLRPASDQAPQATKLTVNVYSAVQVSFRTVL
ncbi:MAG TPA: hypothetical protein VMM92_01475 [Thermoanaerobaculia bacterium]|nr:hypothetical protein [Thermoanaerobaculia bacterium]